MNGGGRGPTRRGRGLVAVGGVGVCVASWYFSPGRGMLPHATVMALAPLAAAGLVAAGLLWVMRGFSRGPVTDATTSTGAVPQVDVARGQRRELLSGERSGNAGVAVRRELTGSVGAPGFRLSGPGADVAVGVVGFQAPVAESPQVTLGHDDRHLVVGAIPRCPAVFRGRPRLLDGIRRALLADRVAVVRSAAGGAGSMGRSQLAATFARACVDKQWDLVAWLPAASSGQVVAGLAAVAEALRLRVSGADARLAAAEALRWLEHRDGRTLVVFDDADPVALAPWLPRFGGTRVVVTTGTTASATPELCGGAGGGQKGQAVEVGPLTAAEAVALLRMAGAEGTDAGLAAVAEVVGGGPSAVAQAGYVLAAQDWDAAEGAAQLWSAAEADGADGAGAVVPGPGDAGEAVVAAALAEVEATDAEAGEPVTVRQVVELLAVSGALGLPRALVLRACGPVADAAVDAVVERLHAAALVDVAVDGAVVVMHRGVRAVAVRRAVAEGTVEAAVAAVAAVLRDGEGRQPVDRLALVRLVEVGAAAWEAVAPAVAGTSGGQGAAAALMGARRDLLRRLVRSGGVVQAVEEGERLVVAARRLWGDGHPQTTALEAELADLHRWSAWWDGDAVVEVAR